MSAAIPPARAERREGVARWWVYQRERFPLLAHGPLIAAFSASGVSFSAALRGAEHGPRVISLVIAFLSALCFFFQLRVADEIKDADDDAAHRPYRPVPRGLVTLGELRVLSGLAALAQVGLALWLDARLLLLLALVWGYMTLMGLEFFARDWLRRRPATVLWTHMLVMPLIDLYVTACDWLPADAPVASGLRWFLVASFFNGIVIEVGRKLRAPEDEERGVETYSVVWGRVQGVTVWLVGMALALGCATMAAARVGAEQWVGGALLVVWLLSIAMGLAYCRAPRKGSGKRLEAVSGVWTLAMYLTLGIAPWVGR